MCPCFTDRKVIAIHHFLASIVSFSSMEHPPDKSGSSEKGCFFQFCGDQFYMVLLPLFYLLYSSGVKI